MQSQFVDIRMAAEKDTIAGYKIGLTSNRMQHLLGIDSPIAGTLLKKGVQLSGKSVKKSDYAKVGLECEIIVSMDRDLPPTQDTKYQLDDIESSILSVSPGFELIDDRWADYRNIDVLSLIADNSWNAGLIVGDTVRSWGDLSQIKGELRRGIESMDSGKGSDVLGHPFHAVLWLANTLKTRGLKKGDYVATGSMIPTIFPSEGESYLFKVSDLGCVAVDIE